MPDKQVTKTIVVDDPDLVLTQFDVILVQRSTVAEVGPFTNITEDVAEAATLLGSDPGPFFVDGLIFSIILDESGQTDVLFSGTDPLTIAAVISDINTQVGSAIAADSAGQLLLTSLITGTMSKLEIVASTALTALGFTAGQRDIGAQAHIPVVSGTQTYICIDEDGVPGYWYRTLYKNTGSGALSLPGDATQADPASPLAPSNLSLCTIDLVDETGAARQGQKITFFPITLILESTTPPNIGVALGKQDFTITTDAAGHAEISLVRGLNVRVVFEGTSLIRDIIVPDAASCDLLGLIGAAEDIFSAAQPNLPAAPRRSI